MELRKVKEVQAAAERLRRERWIDEKTKKIKVRFLSISSSLFLCIQYLETFKFKCRFKLKRP